MKNNPMMSGLPFSSKLRWDFYSVSIAKAASKKIGALISLRSFFLLRWFVVSINLLYDFAWNTAFMTGSMLLLAT